MYPRKLGFYSKLINFATKTCACSNYDLNFQKYRYLHSAYFYTSNIQNQQTHVYVCINNRNHNASNQILKTKLLKYSTKPIEIPESPSELSNESDVFGSIGERQYERVELDHDELKEEERLKEIRVRIPRKFKPSPGQYVKMIKNYIGKGDLQAAEQVLQICKRNKDQPSPYMYTLLIRAFALQGDIKTCYQYFAAMKNRRYKIKANAYTSLLNACANSPDSEKALNYIERIKDYMTKQKFKMNHAHYNVLVKAYGCHNKFEDAKAIFQEMMDKKMKIGISTINSLMYAANSNIECGLKHLLYIWQIMRKLNIPPNLFTYNLLLRAIRDTYFGNYTVNDILLPGDENSVIISKTRPDLLLYPPVISSLPYEDIKKNDVNNNLNTTETKSLISLPSKLAEHELIKENSENSSSIITNLNLDSILKHNKLILFGGLEGLIQKMKDDKIEPTIKTVTYLIELVPNSIAAEKIVIKYAKSQKIPLDVDFFNMLIKKRCIRGDNNEAKNVLQEIQKANLKPNIVTYGVLALACKSSNESRELLNLMKVTRHTLNKYIADSLLSNAFIKFDFGFILELMELMKYEKIRLDESTFEKLDEFQKKMTELVKTKHALTKKERFKVGFSKFNMRYKSWQRDMERKIMIEHE